MKQPCFPFVFLLLLTTGCVSYDTVRHQTFTLQIPAWEHQEKISFGGKYTGLYTTDGQCNINLTFSLQPLFAATHTSFAYLSLQDSKAIITSDISDTVATLTYQLTQPELLQGKLKLLTCPSHYTYVVDYSCSPKLFARRQSDITHVFDSMTC